MGIGAGLTESITITEYLVAASHVGARPAVANKLAPATEKMLTSAISTIVDIGDGKTLIHLQRKHQKQLATAM